MEDAVDLQTLEAEHQALLEALGEESLSAASSLIRLGTKQYHEGLHFHARDNLQRGIRIYKQLAGPFHPQLIEPLTYLGLNYQAMGHHEKATDAFTRAQHVTHRTDGMLNADQVPMIYSKVDSFRVLGELWEVDQLLTSAEKLQRHNYGSGASETVASVNSLGLWHAQRSNFQVALSLYESARQRMDTEHPEFTEAKLDLLKGNAQVFLYVPRLQTRALDLLGEAKQLADDHASEISSYRRLVATLNHADMLMMFAREREALKSYEDAWTLLQTEQDLADLEEKHFAELRMVRSPFKELDPNHLPEGPWVHIGFDLKADGRPTRPRVLDSNASIRFRQAIKAYMKTARFRPQFVDGQASERVDQEMYLAFHEAFLN